MFAIFALVLGFVVANPAASYAANPKDQAFIDSYKKAFESKDEKTLKSFLYTKGADPGALEFYTMMMTSEMGGKITSIELKPLTPAEIKEATSVQPMPDGGNAKLPLSPSMKLVLKIGDPSGNSTSTSESFVAVMDGNYVIPVPAKVQ